MSNQSQASRRRVAVTGGTGKLGKVCVQDLQAHGYDVFVIDTVAPAKGIPHIIADLSDFGQTLDALSSVSFDIHAGVGNNAFDAVVHLAAFPTPA
jgi:nucleoside-diphosphate-sugar epimerase